MGARSHAARTRRSLALVAIAVAGHGVGGCGKPCCTTDERPIPVALGAGGGVVASATADGWNGGAAFPALVDTGGPITLFAGEAGSKPRIATRTLRLVDAGASGAAVRAVFAGVDTLTAAIGPAGSSAASAAPLVIIGGDLLRNFSVEFSFGSSPSHGAPPSPAAPAVTLWSRQGAGDGFLSSAGYAVVHFTRRGGGEIDGEGKPDFLGLRGPPILPRTRIVVRGCAAPADFEPDSDVPRCCRNQEAASATGTDLALLLSTGTGPLVLGRRVWERIAARTPGLPDPAPGPALLAPYARGNGPGQPSAPIEARWTTLPRLAIVNQESSDGLDPGPCVELARSRRIEQVARRQVLRPELNACTEPCDRDPGDRAKAQNSAAYADVGGSFPVAVIEDASPLLQALRFEIRPEGPEIDGILGTAALTQLRMEIDYPATSERLILSCADGPCGGGDRNLCWVGSRCPRLPGTGSEHGCFCLPRHGLPATCGERPEGERCP